MDLFAQADALRADSSDANSFAKFDDIELMESREHTQSPGAFSDDSFRQFQKTQEHRLYLQGNHAGEDQDMIELENAKAMMEELGMGTASVNNNQNDDEMGVSQEFVCDPKLHESPTAEDLLNDQFYEE